MKQKLSKNKYLYKKVELEEIKNPQYLFNSWTRSKLIKLLTKIFLNKENFIKIFDFRIIGSLILRDLHGSRTNKSVILNAFLLLILSIFLYRLNNKNIIEKKYLNLVKMVHGPINSYGYKEKVSEESSIYISSPHFFSPFNLYNLREKNKKKYSIIKENFERKIYSLPVDDQICSWDSEWWKFWIVEQILPSWKVDSSSINKIDALLKTKNTNDLKYFFEFYIDNIICQNYNWEYKFNFIFSKDFGKKIKSKEHKKILEDTLVLQIFSSFCEKLIFEIKNTLKLNNLNPISEFNNNKYFFYIPLTYEKKIFNNLKSWGESDQIIAKSYIFMKKKEWFFFQNYAEFYIWQLYKNYLFYCEKDQQQLNIIKNNLNIKLFRSNALEKNEQNFTDIEKILSDILYKFSKYILYKIKISNKLKKNYNRSIKNYKIIDQSLKYKKKKKLTLSLIEPKFLNFNKNIFEFLFVKKKLDNIFLKDKKIEIKKISKSIYNSFLNILSIDELNMAFFTTSKYIKNFKITKEKRHFFFLRPFLKSDNNRLVIFFKIKKNYKKLNLLISLDYAYKIIQENQYNINKSKLVILTSSNYSSNSFHLLRFNFHKYNNISKFNKKLIFQFKKYINLVNFLDQLNLLIIKSNMNYIQTIDYNIDSNFQVAYKLKKTLLSNQNNYKDYQIKNKDLIQSYLKKKIKFYNSFTEFYIKITKNYNNIYKNLNESVTSLFLINNFFFPQLNNRNLKIIIKSIINKNLLDWKKEKENYFYYNSIKKKYITWNLNLYKLIDKKKESKEFLKYFVFQHQLLTVTSNKIDFSSNRNSIIRWSKKLNKKNIYIFNETFINILFKRFNIIFYKISNLLKFYSKFKIVQNNFSKNIILNKNNLSQKISFDINNILITQLYFDKISISKFFISYFHEKNNNKICIEKFNNTFFFPIWQNQEIYFSFIKTSNKNLLNFQIFETDTLKLLNFLHYPKLYSKKKLFFYIEKDKKNNLTYKQLIKSFPSLSLKKKEFLSINKLNYFYKKTNIDLIIKFQASKSLLSEYLKKINDQKLIFVYNNNLNKLLNSLVRINPFFYEKKKTFFDILTINRLTLKQQIEFKITEYYQFYFKISDLNKKSLDLDTKKIYIRKLLKSNYYFNQIQFFQNYVLSEFFIEIKNKNNKILNWNNKLFTKPKLEKKIIWIISNESINSKREPYKNNKSIVQFISEDSIKLIQETKIYKIFRTSSFFIKWILFKKYILWFFTFEWWKYCQNIVLNFFSEILLNINDQFNYTLIINIQNIQKNLYKLLINLSFILKRQIVGNLSVNLNLRLLKEINNQRKTPKITWSWSDLKLINAWNNQYIVAISLIIFSYSIYQKYFSTLLGSDCFELWRYFEIIRYLIDSSRGIYIDNLINRNLIQFIKSENLLMHFLRNLKHYIKNIKFYLFTKQKLTKWLINNKGLDLSRRERKLLVQSLIIERNINQYISNFTSTNYYTDPKFNYQITKQQKLNYLEHLTENYQKNLVNYPFHQFYLAENLIFLSLWRKITSSQMLWQADTSKLTFNNFHKKPIPLELRLFSSKGILLIGSLETGRSYLIKNIATDSFVPLIKISINKLLYNKPDILTESWMNILMESLRRLNLILELAEKMSPCIIWIQNIHELNVNRSTQNVESDPTFLLGILLKYFQTNFIKKDTRNIVIIGSTHLPKKVDPALISPNRLDRLINIRTLNLLQRKEKLSILLCSKHNKYFYLKNKKSCLNEFGYRTIGYNARDLAALINEILLINITQNQSIIYKNTIKLAFHKQTLGSTYINNKINFTQNYGILFYKVGKVIIQNIFIKNYSRNPLYIGNDLWKKKFYYLSKWYLEPSIIESTIKEFTILPHILGCLAGLAARDSWFILKNKPDNFISLDRYAENDFYLACGILESLLIEFPWLETFNKNNIDKEMKLSVQFQTKNPLYMIKKGLFSIVDKNIRNKLSKQAIPYNYKKKLYQLTSNINWAPKISRLNFIRSNLFNWIKRPNEFEVTHDLGLSRKKEEKSFNGSQENSYFCEITRHRTKEQLPYERILSRIRRRNVQELESQLKNILLEEQFVILGFSQLSTQYCMEYQLSNKPMLFMGGRFLWDPTGLLFQIRHFTFSRQILFIDEEMLRRLYVTYGARREREKSRSSQKIKQFFLRRGYGRDSMNDLSTNWWNQLPFLEKNNIETFKRIEGIGVQLERPQLFTPVYLYQRWLIENPREILTQFKLLDNQQRWLKVNSLLFNDSFIYNTLLEIYQYLLNFFLTHRVLLNKMTQILLKNRWLFQNEIENFINITKTDIKK
uniref:Protein Ycf2 n=1 Tax=Tetraphis pellucida TaxID=37420 RepID=A0A060D872_9BRYO|nr:Ycf2 [Tetraphis pellucida]AIB08520.1 Ycf2 [Tetraphis pellucida]